MSKPGRGLTEDEKKLWRRVAARVKARRPLNAGPQQRAETPEKAAVSRVAAAPPLTTINAKIRQPPQDRGAERRVRRGRLEIGGELDLHGHTQSTARSALISFLRAAQSRGDRTVIVITGVGRSGQGVLRRRLPEWLAEPELRSLVSGFAQAQRTHGGDGAYYVVLRRVAAPLPPKVNLR